MRYLSLFSGVEAATQAWHAIGWECVGVSEIEPNPCAVLAHHYPNVPNLGDVTKITEEDIAALGRIDLVVFGSPCQDLSIAGKRKGFTNADGDATRSGLFFAAMRIIGWCKKHCGTRFALWENVPGAFSNNAGRDFAAVVEQMAGLDGIAIPPKGWGTEGCAVGAKAMVEWSTLDAQWFGVAQRRRRVFALADFGDWANRPPILLEPDRMRGDIAPRREAWQETAGTLASRTGGGGFPGTDKASSGYIQPTGIDVRNGSLTGDVAHTVQSGAHAPDPGETPHVLAFGGNNQSGPIDVATARNGCGSGSGRLDFESETFLMQSSLIGMAVRRLTPRECERLQGMKDDYTRIPVSIHKNRRITKMRPIERWGRNADGTWTLFSADGPRYKAIGNSMAVVVMNWVGRSIEAATWDVWGDAGAGRMPE